MFCFITFLTFSAVMSDSGKDKSSAKPLAAEHSQKKGKKTKASFVKLVDPASAKSFDVQIESPPSSLLPPPRSSPIEKVSEVTSNPVVSPEVSAVLLMLSSQINTLSADLKSTREEFLSLPRGVGDVVSLARVKVPPSATVTTADVHACQSPGDGGVPSCADSAGHSGLTGTYASPVAGFSRESEARLPERVSPVRKRARGESSDPLPMTFRSRGRVEQGRDPGSRRDSLLLSPSAFESVVAQQSQLPASGQGAVRGEARGGHSTPYVSSFPADDPADFRSQAGDILPGITDVLDEQSVFDSSLQEEENNFRLPAKLHLALASAAEVASRYFKEGVVSTAGLSVPPPSALGDFRSPDDVSLSFRFRESPAVAYEMSRIFGKSKAHANARGDIVPLLVAHRCPTRHQA